MNYPATPITSVFNPANFAPGDVGGSMNHQPDLPSIARDAKIVVVNEPILEQVPPRHHPNRRDAGAMMSGEIVV
jgi:hypothetical protein